MNMTINATEMEIGERAVYHDGRDTMIVELRDNELAGGCETNLFFAFVDWYNDDDESHNLCDLVLDSDDYSV